MYTVTEKYRMALRGLSKNLRFVPYAAFVFADPLFVKAPTLELSPLSIIDRSKIDSKYTQISRNRSERDFVLFFMYLWGWSGTEPTITGPFIGLMYQPWRTDDDDDCGAISGGMSDRVNRSTEDKPASAPLCPPQIPHDLTRARTRPALSDRPSYATASSRTW
jgi:hypothetical protein